MPNKQTEVTVKANRITAVLRRALPADMGTDTCVLICGNETTIDDIMRWADRLCEGSTVMLALEIVPSHQLPLADELRDE